MRQIVCFDTEGGKGELYVKGKKIHYFYQPNRPITYLFDRDLHYKEVQEITQKIKTFLDLVMTINTVTEEKLFFIQPSEKIQFTIDEIPVMFTIDFSSMGVSIRFDINDPNIIPYIGRGFHLQHQIKEPTFQMLVRTAIPHSKDRLRILLNEQYMKKRNELE